MSILLKTKIGRHIHITHTHLVRTAMSESYTGVRSFPSLNTRPCSCTVCFVWMSENASKLLIQTYQVWRLHRGIHDAEFLADFDSPCTPRAILWSSGKQWIEMLPRLPMGKHSMASIYSISWYLLQHPDLTSKFLTRETRRFRVTVCMCGLPINLA